VRRIWRRDPTPLTGTALGLALVVALTAAVVPFRADTSRATPALLLVIPVVLAGIVGGRIGAVGTAAAAALAFNSAFIPPFWTLTVDLVDDAVALAVFTAVGLTVGTLVAREGDRRRVAEQRAVALQRLNERYEAVQAERERLAEETTRLTILEQVDAQRAALLRSVSHDLRTPLSAIQAVISDLRAEAGYDDATRRELLDLVIDEAERLDRIVANLLSMSRIEAGALQPDRQAVPVEELVADCVKRLERLVQHVEIELEFPGDLPLADADYSQLDQVVTNLLENAVRHSPGGSTIRVGAEQARHGMLTIWVEDQGPGVPETERDRIFEPFRRGEGSASSGVGLTICKAIVEAHGGTIRAQDAAGHGARFVFSLPARHE
jgi:two-component system, OmpR family, sensor histidine kinase KdpD